ncbi:hypothetical protein GCM10009069_27180 [Algimonas arctica]|uniref:Uncharacterized protein n=1 Tax=Algimonas arctica TaxID=1479486 RepID=A0A8J3CUI5_9PROT|nr:DUF805 domain-containing protein [Algimonas arctica]GHB02963.1 hypothetical protein GCM10009069_27180 [Algimonas arctica]
MGNLLFSPSGRIGPSAYMKGIIIIAVIGAVFSLLTLVSAVFGAIGSAVGLLTFYIFIALGIKRSHDAGKSGWMVLTHILLSWGVLAVVMYILGMVTGISLSDIFSAALSGDQEAMNAFEASTQTVGYVIPATILGMISPIVTGFLVNMFNKQDTGDNQFGPVPAA